MIINIDEKNAVELDIYSIQIEITGKCNLKCRHCRASELPSNEVSIETLKKLFSFAEVKKGCHFIVSGGEPLLHSTFFDILSYIESKEPEEVVITTNGTLINKTHANILSSYKKTKTTVQVSLDSIDENEHNLIRGSSTAYQKAINGVHILVNSNIFTSIRATISPSQLNQMELIIKKAIDLGAKRIGLSTIVPVGRANKLDETLFFAKENKRKFIQNFLYLREKYNSQIEVVTHEPQKACFELSHNCKDKDNQIIFGGCTAGVGQINMENNGDITPCALMAIPITNIFNKTIDEAKNDYKNSLLIKNLIMKNYKGKCGICNFKDMCGGCRAVPFGLHGDPLAEDETCFMNNSQPNSVLL